MTATKKNRIFKTAIVQRIEYNYSERMIICRMAVAYRRMTPEILQYLTGYSLDNCRKILLEKLKPLSFIKYKQEEKVVLLHDEMRDLIEEHWEDPGQRQHKEIAKKLVCYYEEKLLSANYILTEASFSQLHTRQVSPAVRDKLKELNGQLFTTEAAFRSALKIQLTQTELDKYASALIVTAQQEVSQEEREVYTPELIEYAFMADASDGLKRFCEEFDTAMDDGGNSYPELLLREAEFCHKKYAPSWLNALEIELRHVKYYLDTDQDLNEALKLIDSATSERHRADDWKKSIAYGQLMLYKGIANLWLEKFDDAIEFLREARICFLGHEEQEDPLFLANNWIGYAFYRKADFDAAERWMKQSLEGLLYLLAKELNAGKTKKRNIQQRIQYSLGNMAMLCRYQGKFFEAIRNADMQFNIVRNLPRNSKEIFRSLNTLAHVVSIAGRSIDARFYLERAEEIYQKIPDQLLGGRLYTNFCCLSYGPIEFAHMIEYYRAEELHNVTEKIYGKKICRENIDEYIGYAEKSIEILEKEAVNKELADAYFNLGKLYMMVPKSRMPSKWENAEKALKQASTLGKASQFRYHFIEAQESLLSLYYFRNYEEKDLPVDQKEKNERKQKEYQNQLEALREEMKRYPDLLGRYELTLGDIHFDQALDLLKGKKKPGDSKFAFGMKRLEAAFDHYIASVRNKKEFNRDRYHLMLRVLYNRLDTLVDYAYSHTFSRLNPHIDPDDQKRRDQLISKEVLEHFKINASHLGSELKEFSQIFEYALLQSNITEDKVSKLKKSIDAYEEKGNFWQTVLLNKCLIDVYSTQVLSKTVDNQEYLEKIVLQFNRQSRLYLLLGDSYHAQRNYERARERAEKITDPVLKRGLEGYTDIIEGEFCFRQGVYGKLLEFFVRDELEDARDRFDKQFKGARTKAFELLQRGEKRLLKTIKDLKKRLNRADNVEQKELTNRIKTYLQKLSEAYFQLGELQMMNGYFQENEQDCTGAFEYLKQAITTCDVSKNHYRHDDAVQSYLNAIYFSGDYDELHDQKEIEKYEQELEDKIKVDGYKYPWVAARFRITQGDVLFSRCFKREEQPLGTESEFYNFVPKQAQVSRKDLLDIFRKYVEACNYQARFNELSFEAGLRVLRHRIELISDTRSLDILSKILRQIWPDEVNLRERSRELESILQLIQLRSLVLQHER